MSERSHPGALLSEESDKYIPAIQRIVIAQVAIFPKLTQQIKATPQQSYSFFRLCVAPPTRPGRRTS